MISSGGSLIIIAKQKLASVSHLWSEMSDIGCLASEPKPDVEVDTKTKGSWQDIACDEVEYPEHIQT